MFKSIYVCGSEKLDQENGKKVLFMMLDSLYSIFKFENLVVGNSKGTDEYAKEWVREKNKELLLEGEKTKIMTDTIKIPQDLFESFFDGKKLPNSVIKSDEKFNDVAQKMLSLNIGCVVPFPNEGGNLGIMTQNIVQIATLVGIKNFDTSPAIEEFKKRFNCKCDEKQSLQP